MHYEILDFIDNELANQKRKLGIVLRSHVDVETHTPVSIDGSNYYPVHWLQRPANITEYELFFIKFAFVVIQLKYTALISKIPLNLKGDSNDLLWILNIYNLERYRIATYPHLYNKFKKSVVTLIPDAHGYNFNVPEMITQNDFDAYLNDVDRSINIITEKLKTNI